MNFHGIFVGIDRYHSPKIPWLNCAQRDALALHALFKDTLGGEPHLLTDEKATRHEIKKCFEQLAQCHEDDVVVIAFSGHGSETHELVTYDAERDNLAETAISLDALTEWFSRIPARRLICILDCCFSGGMGSKVLQVEIRQRDLCSTEDILARLSGEGRLILTASSPTQPAWEDQRVGHGLLTNYLLEALQGAEEVIQAGKIPFYQLLDYVTQRVTDAAAQFGKKQHPTVKGRIDRRLTWPVFKPGLNFYTAFPEQARPEVTPSIQSLAPYGFSSEILSAWAGVIPSLNPLQLSAINEFNVLNGEHLVVSAPTSSGKTMIGELAALRGILSRKRTIFLLPLKALVNDKQGQFQNLYGSFGVRTIQATGDSTDDIPDLIRGQYDICLMTYEKFTALVFGFPNILEQVGIVVIDEVQMIADRSRGMNLEFILTLLRTRRQHGIEPQLIALSAVIGETNGLERWLDARLLCRTERPVPLDEGIIRADGSFRYIDAETSEEKVTQNYIQRIFRKDSNQDWVIPLVQKLVGEGKQVIVFREKKGEARGAANYLGEALNLPPAQSALDALPSGDPSIISEVLRKCLRGGVAFHTADLDRDERLVIEEQFRQPNSEIRVIAATTTLAMGVNMPAEAVVVVGLEHPNPQDGPQPYFVAEYKNITGRAGRLGLVDRGTSYLLALTPREEHDFWSRYVLGNPEDIKSQFLSDNTDPRSLIVRVLVAARRLGGGKFFGMTDNDIIAFLEGSFGAFQQTQLAENWKWDANRLKEALNNLESHELVRQDEKGIYRLTALGWLAGQGGVEVESITRLVDALRPLEPGSITDQTLIALTQLTVELDDVLFPVNSRGAGKELATWSQELQSQAIPQSVLQQLQRHTADTYQTASRFKKATACLLWVTDMPLVQIEEVLTKHGGRFNGAAGPTRSVSSRTHDILPIVARVAEILHKDLDLTERSARLFTRLEVGIPSSIIDLAKQAGARLSRADYQSLLKSNLSQIEDIQNSSDEDLLACVNDNRTKLSIIRQAVIDHYEQKIDENLSFPLLPEYEG